MTAHFAERSMAETALAREFEAAPVLSRSPRRAAAFSRFQEQGLPTRRNESWHYTDLRAAMREAAPLAPPPDKPTIEAARQILQAGEPLGTGRLVLVNGAVVAELSQGLPASVVFRREEPPSADVDDAMVALNEAMSADAGELRVFAGAALDHPLEIIHLTVGERPQATYSRLAISVEAGAKADLIESFIGATPSVQRNATTLLSLAENASIKHVVTLGDHAGLHVETQIAELASRADLNAFALVAGGALTRRQLFVRLAGEGAKIALGGLALIDGARRADTTLQVNHRAVAGTSREFYRAIVDDDGVGVFQGKIIVEKAAQKTDGAMKSQAILLSPQAQMNAKPELEIFADDVACGHGATIGSLDPEQLFYLQARGIARAEAESMLLEAFGCEAIDRIEDPRLVEPLRKCLAAWLALGRGKATSMRALR